MTNAFFWTWKEANGVLSWLWIQREKQLSPILGVVIVMNIEKNTFCTALWSSCKAMHSYLPQTMKQWELASDLVAYWSSNQQFYKISSSFVTVSIIYDSASSNSSKVYLTWTEHKKKNGKVGSFKFLRGRSYEKLHPLSLHVPFLEGKCNILHIEDRVMSQHIENEMVIYFTYI